MASAVAVFRGVRLEPVVRERMADLETPVSAFAKLRRLGGAFLLESAEGGERMGRYSFIGVAPREVIVSRDGDPLAALRRAMAGYARTGAAGLPRFSGGAVGYVAYEAARHFERLPLAARDPFGLPDAVFGIYDTVVAFDHLRHTMLLVAHAAEAIAPPRSAGSQSSTRSSMRRSCCRRRSASSGRCDRTCPLPRSKASCVGRASSSRTATASRSCSHNDSTSVRRPSPSRSTARCGT